MTHDVIAIGASAGGFGVLLDLVGRLPANLPASIFIVLHTAPADASRLPELLSKRGPLPASHPLHEEPIVPGRIYVASPDNHLLVRPGAMEVVRGAKENGHRPAVDALFRTASSAYGPRVVGVVLSGYQDCGTAGMMSIKARGGVSVVQSPESAQVPDMPRSVLARVPVDHVVSPAELPTVLTRLVATPAGAATRPDAFVEELEGERPGAPAELVCPLCDGVLTEAHPAQPGVFEHFRCHVGHAFSLDALVREQGEAMERALWAAVRSLEEGAALSGRLIAHEPGEELRRRFSEKARTQLQQAELIRQVLLHGAMLSRGDAARLSAAETAQPRAARRRSSR
ncbi:MAG TPA: chemotaxis protein CheB [Polyangia bacterium]|nr:chemotaxis protein CheB [Polyangia bacterium]